MAHSKKTIRVQKILRRYVLNRCAERGQGIVNRLRVRFVGPDENIEIFCCTRLRVKPYCVSTTIKYLTCCAFKVDKSSLKSGYIGYLTLHRIQVLRNFGNRVHPLIRRSALPIPVFVSLRLIKARVLAKGLVHAFRLVDDGVGPIARQALPGQRESEC
jgi:hypothetical protein